jgi:MFS family permease
MVFSFGPALLVERGWSVPAAGSATSIVLWLAVVSVPLGGLLADRRQWSGVVLVAGCAAFGVLLFAAARGMPVIPTFVALGLVCGLAAGPIMSLPTLVLGPATRTAGMGLFYAVYYATMMLGPALAGYYASFTGTAAGALDFGAALILACPLLLIAFRVAAGRVAREGA